MADGAASISNQQTKPIKVLKWKIREGITVSVGRIILLYEIEGQEKPEQKKLKAIRAGTIDKIIAQEGNTVLPREPLYSIIACSHPTIMNDMCAECGADLRKEEAASATASVPMIHSIPDLKVSEEQAQQLGKADSERLIKDRKLVLLVDLDQTLIHTTNDNIPPNIKDVYHFQLYGPSSPWYHTRLRPGTHKFLNNIYDFFELHICTFGARNYAHTIAMFLDPEQKFFSNRILSRDECFDPTSKKANLKALFPCGDDMVCIIDDREDVWNHASNLIHVKPYHFFQHTGDINAPPGLDKHENDEKAGVDLTNITNNVEKNIETSTNGVDGKICKEEKNVEVEKLPIVKDNEEEQQEEKDKKMTNGNITDTSSDPSDVSAEVTTENNEQIKEPCDKVTEEELKENDASKENSNEKEDAIDQTSSETLNGKLKNAENDSSPEEDADTKVEPTPKITFNKEENLIEIEDPDDYLIYLEDILKRIHKLYYEEYDKMESGEIPDLKKIIPVVRSNVLDGCKLVFSGLVPTHVKLENSKAYQVARSLGAYVTQDLEDDTTHIVAVRPGTAKVNAGKRKKHLKIVTPDWLWSCAERWEHVDERIFPLNSKGSKNRHPPPHCSSPEHITAYPEHSSPALRKRTPSGRFMDTINPLMSFSSDDIADMDKEVEDILEDDESDEEEEGETYDEEAKQAIETAALNKEEPEGSSSSSEGMDYDEGDYPKGHKRKQHEVIVDYDDLEDGNNSTEDEPPSVKFRRGESIDNVLDVEPDEDGSEEGSGSSFEPPDPDEMDDGEWNMMGAALEREFLSE